MNPDSPAEIRALLDELGLALKKRWGQNFLVNRGARERLIELLQPGPFDTVWEIGPGLGAMSGALLARARRLVVFEIDRGMCRHLEGSFGASPSFVLVPGDFVETWQGAAASHGLPGKLLGNLPYRSASLMIASIVEGGLRPGIMVFTVQKELAERMTSPPAMKSYSSFSVLCQAVFHVALKGDLRPGSFHPAPKVISTIVEMRPRENGPSEGTLSVLSALTRGLFSARRKTIRNNLATGRCGPRLSMDRALAALEREGIDPGGRAEDLAPDTFLRVARAISGAP
jgi:16S rRNA (adenine1518-N6/adenine1519-N6)-dimethyltransferase